MTTHRVIQISQLLDKSLYKATASARAVSNLQRIGNRKGAIDMLDSAEQWTRIASRCKRLLERDQKQRAQLMWAKDMWLKAAREAEASGNHGLADSCERAAKSLQIQHDTGIAVCSCCFKPFGRGISFLEKQ